MPYELTVAYRTFAPVSFIFYVMVKPKWICSRLKTVILWTIYLSAIKVHLSERACSGDVVSARFACTLMAGSCFGAECDSRIVVHTLPRNVEHNKLRTL